MYFDPFEEFVRMSQEMNQLLDRGAPQAGLEGRKDVALYRKPLCDVAETDKSVIATFEIPGANKEDIQMHVQDNVLELKVERKMEKESKDEKKGVYAYHKSFGQFFRRLPLPAEVADDKAEATYKDGVLKVEIPKAIKQVKSRQILIN
ncbi:MAG: Hsp20/alpha crystallin family protein [Nanoarchaeota archaeon]